MQKIYLSDAGPKVSPGIYSFHRWDMEATSSVQNMETIVNLCLDLGINTFDHADSYGSYQAEELFGQAMSRKSFKREDIILFTKCGLRLPHPSQPEVRLRHYDNSKAHILKSINNSLRKLRTDYIDVFLLNYLDPVANLEETAFTLKQLKESGKIKNIGIANFSVFQHQSLASLLQLPIVTNHIELNLLNTSALDNGQIDYIKQRYMRPLASGPLADGQIAHGTSEQAVCLRDKLIKISAKYNSDIESIAVAWIIKLGALPLIGTRDEQRLRNAVNAFNLELDHQDWYELWETCK